MFSADISLLDHRNQPFSLASWLGSYVVIYVYPKDFTSGCTKEAQQFRDSFCAFHELNTKVLAISKDSVESHARFSAKHDLPFVLLSDPDLDVISKLGALGTKNVYGKKVKGVIRTTVLLDPTGHMIESWHKVRVKGHVEQVLERVRQHRATQLHGQTQKPA